MGQFDDSFNGQKVYLDPVGSCQFQCSCAPFSAAGDSRLQMGSEGAHLAGLAALNVGIYSGLYATRKPVGPLSADNGPEAKPPMAFFREIFAAGFATAFGSMFLNWTDVAKSASPAALSADNMA